MMIGQMCGFWSAWMLLLAGRTRRLPVAGSSLVTKVASSPYRWVGRQHHPPLVYRYLKAVSDQDEVVMAGALPSRSLQS